MYFHCKKSELARFGQVVVRILLTERPEPVDTILRRKMPQIFVRRSISDQGPEHCRCSFRTSLNPEWVDNCLPTTTSIRHLGHRGEVLNRAADPIRL